MADGLFGLCGSERLGRATRRYQPRRPTKLVFEISSGPEVFLDPSVKSLIFYGISELKTLFNLN